MATRPVPKWCCQMRLTMTRANSGFSGDVTQLANAVRRPVETRPVGGGSIAKRFFGVQSAAGTPGCTSSPGLVVLAALQEVMRRRLRVGLHERRDLLQRLRPVLLALGDRLLHPVAQRGVLGEPLRQVVVADLDRLRVLLEQCLLGRRPLLLGRLHGLDDRVAVGGVEVLQALVEELLAQRLGERGQARPAPP